MARTPNASRAADLQRDEEVIDNGNQPEAASETNTAVAVTSGVDAAFTTVSGEAGYVIKKRVTLPVLPFANGATIVCKFITAIHTGKQLKETQRGPKMGPAEIATVESVSGMQCTLICGEVLRNEIRENYPEDGYVGLWFHMHKIAPRGDRRYATYAITEIEPPNNSLAV
jgi:hypothetical protein